MKWISVKDKLPDTHEQFIIKNYVKGGKPKICIMCAVFYDNEWFLLEYWGADEREKINGVTHWMSLPKS